MSRKREIKPRGIHPDAKFGNVTITKFMNNMMYDGKRSITERNFYQALEIISEKLHMEPVEAFDKALDNIRPLIEVRSRRVGGATYQVPVEVRKSRQTALAIRWLIKAARQRKAEKTIAERLAGEFIDAVNGRGVAVKKREDTHKMAEANKAFSHYRW